MTYPNKPTESASDYIGSTSFVAPSDHTKTEKRHKKKENSTDPETPEENRQKDVLTHSRDRW